MNVSHRFRGGFLALTLAASMIFAPLSADAKKSSKQTAAEQAAAEALEAERQAAYDKEIDSNSIENWPQGPQIYAESAIVMEASTGAILYNKDMDMVNYPASITKIMTALLTLENCSLDEVVTYSYYATHSIEAGSSSIGTTEGEQLTVEQSLYALLLESANECGNGLAEHVAGSVDAFVEMMNEKAAELGCTNTHFVNPHGLHDDDHYTSAHDMALIMQAALQNPDFVRISGTAKYQMAATNKDDEITYMTNHHYMIAPYKGVSKYLDDTVIAGKTGGTSAAKNTLVTAAERNGMTLIVVTMRTASTGETGVPTVTDTALLLDYASENFSLLNVSENETKFTVNSSSSLAGSAIFGQSQPLIAIDSESGIVLPNGVTFTDASPELTFQDDSEDSSVIATLSYTYEGQNVGSATIEMTDADLQGFTFSTVTDEDSDAQTDGIQTTTVGSKRFIKINVRLLLIIVVIIAAALLLFFLIRRLIRNLRLSPNFSRPAPGQYSKSRKRKAMFRSRKKPRKRYRRKPKKRRNDGASDLDL